jgi:hypothetical protein
MDMKRIYNPDIHHRRSIRLKQHDYSKAGAEHIIRDENEINRVREYIAANPSRWLEDEENPVNR